MSVIYQDRYLHDSVTQVDSEVKDISKVKLFSGGLSLVLAVQPYAQVVQFRRLSTETASNWRGGCFLIPPLGTTNLSSLEQ